MAALIALPSETGNKVRFPRVAARNLPVSSRLEPVARISHRERRLRTETADGTK